MILRHPRGRGRLYDDAEANRGVYLDKTSSASGFAKLRDCELRDTRARERCQIFGGLFRSSEIAGKVLIAGSPTIAESVIACREISGTPVILNSVLLGNAEIWDAPYIEDCTIKGDALIYGDAQLRHCLIEAGRVHEGQWRRPPKYIKLPWADLTECVDGKVLLDCRCRTTDYWLKHGAKLARRWDWSEEMIEITLETIRREFVLPKLQVASIMRA